MVSSNQLTRAFFNRPTLQVARELLGTRLVHIENGQRIAGIITETEAYCGEKDLGCHAKAGRTPRTLPLYGPPGHAYVYFTYGMHWLFNCVTRPEGEPEAVLIRALEPTEGLPIITKRRVRQPKHLWTNGPAKLAQALGITGSHNTLDLTAKDAEVFIENGFEIPNSAVTTGPRVGFNNVPEPWKSKPWRFLAALQDLALS